MAASRGGATAESQDNLIYLIGALILIVWAVIYFGDKPFVTAALWSAKLKIELLQLLHLAGADDLRNLAKIEARLASGRVEDLGWWGGAWILSQYFRLEAVLFALFLGFLSLILFVSRPAARYVRRHNMKSLLFQKARVHPEMRPVYGLMDYLTKRKSFFTGPWRLGDSPIQFALRNRLLYRRLYEAEKDRNGNINPKKVVRYIEPDESDPEFYDPDESLNEKSQEARENWMLDTEKATKVFKKQLGMPMISNEGFVVNRVKKWPRHHRALLAAFMLIRFAGRKHGYRMLHQFSSSFWSGKFNEKKSPDMFKPEKLNMEWVDEVIDNYLLNKPLPEDCPYPPLTRKKDRERLMREFTKHGWSNVIMFHMLEKVARQRGIVITAEFIWLRPMDRTLYYALNNAGRNNPNNATAFSEGAGVVAHWFVEESYGGPLNEPDVRDAVEGLEDALYRSGWIVDSRRHQEEERNKRLKKLMAVAAKEQAAGGFIGGRRG